MHKPFISVITAVFNGEHTLQATIDSIAAQLTDEIEYIIIDGGSTDGTKDIIRRNHQAIHYWSSEPDNGIYDAWNKGLKVARGNYISFVGADDTLSQHILNCYIEHAKKHPEVDYWSSRIAFGEGGRIIGKPWEWKAFRRYMNVAHVGSLHSRRLYTEKGGYNTSYKIAGDYEFLLRFGKSLRTGYVDTISGVMGAAGVSNKQAHLALDETMRAKISTGACSRIEAVTDRMIAALKLSVKSALRD